MTSCTCGSVASSALTRISTGSRRTCAVYGSTRAPARRRAEGGVTEGPGFTVFAHVDGIWRPPASGTLHGITRRTAIELLREGGARVDEGPLAAADVRRADEVLVTSTAGGVIPVTAVDG